MPKHLNIKIYGRVQGVFFRHSAKQKAEELNIKGFAKNEPDGTVYIEAEGEEENLKKFLDWCYQGPPMASVKKVEFEFSSEIKNFSEFVILR
jgi:acylphosphatase